MKIKRIFIALAAVLITGLSQAQTSDLNQGCAPLTVKFTAPASATTYFWDFKDLTTSNLQNPTHMFTNPGTYVVAFRKTSTGPVIGTITITVYPKPNPQITSNITKGCVPLSTNISASTVLATGVTLDSYKWTFGDGTGSIGVTVPHTYTVPGAYSISIELKTNFPSCNITKIFPNYINCSTPPNSTFTTTPNPASSCTAPFTVNFTPPSTPLPLTYKWDMGNGQTYTIKNPPAQTYTALGAYPVSLKTTDANNCASTIIKNVIVGKPNSSFSIPDTVCINVPITTIQNLSTAGTPSWNFGPNATYILPTNSTTNKPVVKFNAGGPQTIKLTTSNGGCSDDTTIVIYVENPSVTYTATPAYSCTEPVTVQYFGTSPNNVSKWVWDFNPLLNINNPTFKHNLPLDSADTEIKRRTFFDTLRITTVSGCKASYARSVIIHPPWARFIPDTTKGCAPLTVMFNDSSRSAETITNWYWNYGDLTPINPLTNGNPHTHTFTSPGNYDVVLSITNANGCKDTSYKVRIEVGTSKTLDFSVDKTSICPGESVQFTNTTTTANKTNVDAWHYSSNNEILSHCTSTDNPSIKFDNKTGPQTITLTADYNGCYSSVTKTNLIDLKGPIADFNYLISCGTPFDIKLSDSSKSATSLSWDFGDGTTSTAGGTFTHTYAAIGDYNIILTATNPGCADSKDTITAHIRNIKANFTTSATTNLLCGKTGYNFDGTTSVDENPSCFRGYSWIFSDPTLRPYTTDQAVSTLSLPTSGTQTVGLVVTDINGCNDTLKKSFRVFNFSPNFSVSDNNICLPDTVTFTDLSLSDTTYTRKWNFGDGSPFSAALNPQHPYSGVLGNLINVSLEITNTIGCIGSTPSTISIYTPFSGITSTVPDICIGAPVTLNVALPEFSKDGSFLEYKWNKGDGTPNVNGPKSITHTYATSGTKTVTLTYTENPTGCSGTVTKDVRIQDYPIAGFVSDVDTFKVLCNPQQVKFTNKSTTTSLFPLTADWDWGSSKSTLMDPTTVFQKGIHIISMIIRTSFGCKDTISDTLNVIGPKGDFDMDINKICKGEPIEFTIKDTIEVGSYTWDFGDGYILDDISPTTHKYQFLPPSGNTVAKLTIYGENNICPITVEDTVFIHYVKADFTRNNGSSDTILCLGEVLNLTNTSSPATGNDFQWKLGDGGTSTSPGSFNHTYSTKGTYGIILSIQNRALGCTDTTTKLISVVNKPVVIASGDTVCASSTAPAQLMVVNHTALNGYTYHWSPSTVLNDSTIYNPTLQPINSTNFTVTVTDSNNCIGSDNAYLYVVPELTGFTFDTTIVVGDYVYLPINNTSGTVNFNWSPAEGLSCLNCSYPRVQPLKDITYGLYAGDIFGCSNADYVFNIHVRPETFIELPTTFTPNGDGTNDIIYVKGWGIKDLLSFQIYNRWGEIVFETSELAEGWNGYFKGVLQNNDIYVYKVFAKDWFENNIQKEGHINLVR